jgi:hypothetical protein
MLVPNLIVINYPKPTSGANALTTITILLLAPSSHVLLHLTQFTWHDGISNLVSLITKTKLGISAAYPSIVGNEENEGSL